MMREIKIFPDYILREKAAEVEEFNDIGDLITFNIETKKKEEIIQRFRRHETWY